MPDPDECSICCGGARPTNTIARGSFGYMKSEGLFPLADIEVLFQDYVPKAYPQLGRHGGLCALLVGARRPVQHRPRGHLSVDFPRDRPMVDVG